MTALKRKDFSGVVNKEKDKKRQRRTTGNENMSIHLLCMWEAVLMAILGKTKAEKKEEKEKACKSGQSKGWRGCWEHHKSCG